MSRKQRLAGAAGTRPDPSRVTTIEESRADPAPRLLRDWHLLSDIDDEAKYIYNTYCEVRWDPRKARANYFKHGVRFSDAEGALHDPLALTREDEDSEGECRFVSIGMDSSGKIVVVVFGVRGESLRLISARRATKMERRCYAKGIRLQRRETRPGGQDSRKDPDHDLSR